MIDSINLQISSEQLPHNYKHDFEFLFTDHSIKKDKWGLSQSARFKNFGLMLNDYGLFINGSLSKYYLGSNQKTLRQEDIAKAFDQLSFELSLPILQAKVNRTDLAENVITNQPVNQYYTFLGDCRGLKRLEVDGNILYQNKKKKGLLFYDKTREVKGKKKTLVDAYNGKNLMRIENRFMKHSELVKFLGVATVTVEDIILHYPDLVNAWFDQFNNIEKYRNRTEFNPMVFDEKGAFDKQIRIMGVEAIGGIKAIAEMVKAAKQNKQFKYDNRPSNILNRYKALMATPQLTVKSPLVDELEKKVKIAHFVNAERPRLNHN